MRDEVYRRTTNGARSPKYGCRLAHITFQKTKNVIGTVARYIDDTAPVDAAFKAAIEVPVPVYFEDDHTGVGTCAICGKRGALGRCAQCGLLFHIGCMGIAF